MSQDTLVRLQCVQCKNINYSTTRNKKTIEEKLELKKFCNFCRAHQVHKEAKKKGK